MWPGLADGGVVGEPGKRIPEELDAAAAEVLDEYLDELLLRLHGEPRTPGRRRCAGSPTR
jgi:hypothetical protein